MMKDTTTSILAAGLLSIALTATGAPAATAHDDDRRSHRSWTVTAGEQTTIATDLVSPLRVAVGRGKTAYVSQNFSGRLTAFERHDEPVDLVNKPGIEVGGVSTDHGRIYFTESVGGPGETAPPVAKLSVYKRGTAFELADLHEYEVANDPDKDAAYGFQGAAADCFGSLPAPAAELVGPGGGEVYSHPFATAPSRHDVYVADAGANAILAVNKHSGATRTVAVLPPVPNVVTPELLTTLEATLLEATQLAVDLPECALEATFYSEPVPTDIEIGDDGFLYVTSLPGIPEAPDAGSVLRINPWSGEIAEVASGLQTPTGLAIDRWGNIFVAELFGNRISVIKAGTGVAEPFMDTMMPADVEIDGRNLYATTNALLGGPPPEEPAAPAPGGESTAEVPGAPAPTPMLIKIELEYDRNR